MVVVRREDCHFPSLNGRIDTIQAAMLLVKLEHLDEWTEKRRSNAHIYQTLLATIPSVKVLQDEEFTRSVYHTFVIQAQDRDNLKAYLTDQGVGTAIHYPVPIHLQEAAKNLGYGLGSFPVTEEQAQNILSLPVYPELTEAQLEYVAGCVRNFYN